MKIKRLENKVKNILQTNSFKLFSKLKLRKNGVYGKARKNILHLAIKYSKEKFVIYCIKELKISVSLKSKSLNTALHYACKYSSLSTVKLVYKCSPILINLTNNYNQTPLILAARYNRPEICIFLIEQGANVKVQDKGGNTVGHYACYSGMLSVLQRLQNLFDFSVRNRKNETCLHFAAWSGSILIFDFILHFLPINSFFSKEPIGPYLKGNWELIVWIVENKLVKVRTLEKVLYQIQAPLAVFERLAVHTRIYDILGYDRADLIRQFVMRENISLQEVWQIVTCSDRLQPRCTKWMQESLVWGSARTLLFVYSYASVKLSALPVCILRLILAYLKPERLNYQYLRNLPN